MLLTRGQLLLSCLNTEALNLSGEPFSLLFQNQSLPSSSFPLRCNYYQATGTLTGDPPSLSWRVPSSPASVILRLSRVHAVDLLAGRPHTWCFSSVRSFIESASPAAFFGWYWSTFPTKYQQPNMALLMLLLLKSQSNLWGNKRLPWWGKGGHVFSL